MESICYSIGFAFYHCHDLSRDPLPLAALLERPLGAGALDAQLTRVRKARADRVKLGPAQRYRRKELLAEVATGEVGTCILSSPTLQDGSSNAFLCFDTTPKGALGEDALARACPWSATATFACEALPAGGPEALIAAFLSFAERTGTQSGVAVVTGSMHDAYTLLTGAGIDSSTLSDEEKPRARRARRERDNLGRSARAPEWGTLLSAEHLRQLGGDVWLGRQDCASVAQLGNGAVFLQLTERAEQRVGPEARAKRARLEEAMGPVLTQ